jgi:uncharacterized alpha-E superfamily protein
MADAVLRVGQEGAALANQLGHVARLAELLRDRLTGDMYATLSQSLRDLTEQLRAIRPGRTGRRIEEMAAGMGDVLQFAATVAGLAAENMVRGGGHLFLDLGRRIERAGSIALQIARCLDQPEAAAQPARLEVGLRLALELCDSVITYRSRYLTVLQPAPVLDLILADEGNPRGLAFQLAAARDRLAEIAGEAETPLVTVAEALLADVRKMVNDVAETPLQAQAAIQLTPLLRACAEAIAALSDQITRRYFALVPAARSVGVDAHEAELRGAA